MTTALDTTAGDPSNRALLRSPGLNQFGTSPFRVLRLSPGATAKQAIWQYDKALARARVGLPLPDPDLVPWLPAGDDVQIQEAVQTIESPLARLIEQLLWFDASDDLAGSQLLDGLVAADAVRLRGYLETEPGASITQRINAANLRLLLGFSLLHDVGPLRSAPGDRAASGALAWRREGALSVVQDPHAAVRPHAIASSGTATWDRLLGNGITAWGDLLRSPQLAEHIRAKIVALDDELLTGDDLEAVVAGVRTRLADLLVGETKLEAVDGRLDNVALLSAIAARSNIDTETWLVAFRTMRTHFQAELSDLAPNTTTGLGVVEDVGAYLDRLVLLARRWHRIDGAQLLGLSSFVDDALQAAFGRLRGASTKMQTTARFREVLALIGELAQSLSLKEKVKGYQERLADLAKAMCYFCNKRELEIDYCAALQGKKEISREHYGNTTTIRYQVATMPVARCKRCAAMHHFIYWASIVMLCATLPLVLYIPVRIIVAIVESGAGARAAGYILAAMIFGVVWGLLKLYWVIQGGVGQCVVPQNELGFRDYLQSRAAEALTKEGLTSFKYSYGRHAWRDRNSK